MADHVEQERDVGLDPSDAELAERPLHPSGGVDEPPPLAQTLTSKES